MAWRQHQHVAMFGNGEDLQPTKGKGHRFCLVKGEHPLPFIVQWKLKFEFIYDHDNGFCTLMIHLIEPNRKYEGGMQCKLIQI